MMGRHPRYCARSFWGGFPLLFPLLAILVGCGSSPPTRFHVLTAIDAAARSSAASELSIGIGPVSLPGYLDRPQIVTRSGGTDLELAEFHQWAESLHTTFVRILGENLSTLVSTDRVHLHPWGRTPVDYRITVDVTQFEAIGNGSVVLAARWGLSGGDDEGTITVRRAKFTIEPGGAEYSDRVKAMSQAVEALSREVASSVASAAGRK